MKYTSPFLHPRSSSLCLFWPKFHWESKRSCVCTDSVSPTLFHLWHSFHISLYCTAVKHNIWQLTTRNARSLWLVGACQKKNVYVRKKTSMSQNLWNAPIPKQQQALQNIKDSIWDIPLLIHIHDMFQLGKSINKKNDMLYCSCCLWERVPLACWKLKCFTSNLQTQTRSKDTK